jgi:drug/metabolite transporter (DMT)-like permease
MSAHPIDSHRFAGTLFVAVSAVGFGALGVFGKLVFADGASIQTVLFLRFLVGGLFMVILVKLLRLPWPRGKDLGLLVGMGALGYVGQAFCYFSALRHATAGLTALLLYLYPSLVALAAAMLGRQRLTWLKGTAIAASLVGVFLTVSDGLEGSGAGVVFGIGAAVIYTIYILVGERVVARTGSLPATTVIMVSAAAVFGMGVVAEGPAWPGSQAGWLAMAGIALLSTVVAMVGFFAGMQRLGATDAATISTLEPVVTLLLAYGILGETLGMKQSAGALMVICAVLVLARSGTKRRRQSQDDVLLKR